MVFQVEGVSLVKAGQSSVGTLHLTAHHLIFRHETGGSEEMWVSRSAHMCFYLRVLTTVVQDLVSVTCPHHAPASGLARAELAQHTDTHLRYLLSLVPARYRDGRRVRQHQRAHRSLCVPHDAACATSCRRSSASLDKLYAFYYQPQPPLASQDGWNVYSPREEFGRMGVGVRSRAWRFTDINKDYSVRFTFTTSGLESYVGAK
jgi:myotubularin-related protein 6/7/8